MTSVKLHILAPRFLVVAAQRFLWEYSGPARWTNIPLARLWLCNTERAIFDDCKGVLLSYLRLLLESNRRAVLFAISTCSDGDI